MSNNINPLMNFDRPQEHAIDSALVQGLQALDSYEAQVPHHLQQNLGRQQQQQGHPHQHHQQLQHHQHQQNGGQLQQHHNKQRDQSNDPNHQRLMQQVPIDPSINDGSSEKNAAVAAAAVAAAGDLINARNTAQAAVNSKMSNSGNNTPSSGPKITKPRINKPGQKFGAKKKSWVWNWFIQDPVDSNVATCDFCGKLIKRLPSDKGSPKKLGEHLKTHKIDRNSINPKRDSMIVGDANRHYFNTLNATQTFKPHPLSNQPSNHHQSQQSPSHQQQQQQQQQSLASQNPYGRSSSNANSSSEFTNPNYDKSEFDQSAYSQPKFQKDIMKFLVENKLPLAIVKSPSFRQVIFTLKPEAIPDLNELNHLYSSLLEVIHNEKGPLSNVDDSDQQNDSGDRQTSRHDDPNVDDSLNNSTAGWV